MYNEPADLITIDELCGILSIGRNAAYGLLNEGKIKAFRIGKVWKIPRIALDEYILEQSGLKDEINGRKSQLRDITSKA